MYNFTDGSICSTSLHHHPPPEEKVAAGVDEELHMVVALHHLELVLLGQEGVQVVADVGVRVEDGVADPW